MKLLPLNCPTCQTPLAPADEALILLCDECHTPVHIAEDGLHPVEITYAAPAAETQISEWRPFWISTGQVHVLARKTQSGGSQDQAAQQLWGQPRRLYVPAWALSMRVAQDIGSRMIQRQPRFQGGDPPTEPRLLSVVLTAEDSLKLLEFIILAIEARRSDWLTDFRFKLDVEPPTLWALPAAGEALVALEDSPPHPAA